MVKTEIKMISEILKPKSELYEQKETYWYRSETS